MNLSHSQCKLDWSQPSMPPRTISIRLTKVRWDYCHLSQVTQFSFLHNSCGFSKTKKEHNQKVLPYWHHHKCCWSERHPSTSRHLRMETCLVDLSLPKFLCLLMMQTTDKTKRMPYSAMAICLFVWSNTLCQFVPRCKTNTSWLTRTTAKCICQISISTNFWK